MDDCCFRQRAEGLFWRVRGMLFLTRGSGELFWGVRGHGRLLFSTEGLFWGELEVMES